MAKLARFEIYPDASGRWRFRLVAANGEIISPSQSYSRKADAKRATRAWRLAAMTARTVDGTN